MKILTLALLILATAAVAAAQDDFEALFAPQPTAPPAARPVDDVGRERASAVDPRYDIRPRGKSDAMSAVHRRAAQRGAERQRRIAAQKWYGISIIRPTVNPTPWGTPYAPRWKPEMTRYFATRPAPTVVVAPVASPPVDHYPGVAP